MALNQTARVLVVDDEPELRELLTDALAADDLQVLAAASEDEALALAADGPVDLIVADLRLGDHTGLDVIAHLRETVGDIPAVVITGCDDTEAVAEATQIGLVELMTKPLDMDRLRMTVRQELERRSARHRTKQRTLKLRDLARGVNIERKQIGQQLDSTCADLTAAYKALSSQMALQQIVIGYQGELIGAKCDDDVFRSLFQLFVRRSGPVHGIALVCNEDAELHVVGRFGVPTPDQLEFCQALCLPLVELALTSPQCTLMDAGDEAEQFPEQIRRYLPGLSALLLPLVPEPGELIGLVVLYRKGEQPFTDLDISLAEMTARPTAVAVRRNE